MPNIVQLFLNEEKIKIIVWVTPQGARAASAGTMITMAAHFAAMAPSTSMGAATPISGDGKEIPKDLKNKVQNDTLAFVEGIATKRGRNANWAKDTVSKALSSTAEKALTEKAIDAIATSRENLWVETQKKFSDLPKDVEFTLWPQNTKERFLSFISNPNIAYGLMALGGLCIYVEITSPGAIVPGVVGALSLALGAITMKIIPIEPGAVLLLLIGLILIAIEVLTTIPTYGVAGFGGALSLFLSGLFLMDETQTDLTLNPTLWLPTFFVLVGGMIIFGFYVAKSIRSKNYLQGMEALLGQTGEVISASNGDHAKIRVHGEIWTAKWADGLKNLTFRQGDLVTIQQQKGFVVYVEPKKKE